MFKLKSLTYGSELTPATVIKMFGQLVKPVCLYGSEIRGAETFNGVSMDKIMMNRNKGLIEKLNLSICRHALGVHKKAQVSAVLGELG